MEQADGDRLDALALQESRRSARRRLVEGHEHLPGRAEALDDTDGAVARHERLRLLELRVVERGAHLTCDLEQIAEALRGHEAAARDLALDDRVRGDRRRVHDEADLRRLNVRLRERPVDSVHEPLGWVGRRRQRLRDRDAPGLLVDQGRVRKRPADVDCDPNAQIATP